ncbi:nucleotidyltransferase domain-containing protein [Aphanothece sacrum]|uniref:DNA polymerase beta domain protein region n=1 Tax=Aphanothece sacrum FPU1 TaxID=1920663 RepID=A0A401IFK3_APHSA|nr:nucleotidyltransferase domain-containing protein [Aphanothece sacrum]GBF79989.1 DNA polymerase beta domain protein region [Aphanothece sacrum FPU1]GBF83791.1 DNA polymerase beta domain protein region [Aphanothece sacrum FPU3]
MTEKYFVIDVNVFVSAFLFVGSKPRQALDKSQDLGLVLLSNSIFIELIEVINRPKFDRYLSPERKNQLITYMEMLTSPKLNPLLQELHQVLNDLYCDRLVYIILYGSQARGTANQNSDIDIMVVLKGKISSYDEIKRMGEVTTELSLKYDELISIFPISEETYLSQSTPLLKNIRKEGLMI